MPSRRFLAIDQLDLGLLLRRDLPFLAQLAVAGHAAAPDAVVVAEQAVDLTLDLLPKPLAAEQLDAILGMVDGALRAHLEHRVMEHREYRSELFRGIFQQGAAEGRAAGQAEGEAKGKAEGEAKGKAEGEAKGKAEGILTVLSARGIPVKQAIRERILACTNVRTLDLWLRRAVVAANAESVVGVKGAATRGAKAAPAAKRATRPATRR